MCSDEAFQPRRKATIETSDEAKEFINEASNRVPEWYCICGVFTRTRPWNRLSPRTTLRSLWKGSQNSRSVVSANTLSAFCTQQVYFVLSYKLKAFSARVDIGIHCYSLIRSYDWYYCHYCCLRFFGCAVGFVFIIILMAHVQFKSFGLYYIQFTSW